MRPNLEEIAASGEGRVGKQLNVFIPPDVFYMKVMGEMTDEEGSVVNRTHWEVGKDIDGLFFLVDISGIDTVSAEVRKGAVEVQKNMKIAGAVVLKAPLKARIFAKLILTATNIFKTEKMPVMFVDTVDEAWDWIEKRREEYHAKRKAS